MTSGGRTHAFVGLEERWKLQLISVECIQYSNMSNYNSSMYDLTGSVIGATRSHQVGACGQKIPNPIDVNLTSFAFQPNMLDEIHRPAK